MEVKSNHKAHISKPNKPFTVSIITQVILTSKNKHLIEKLHANTLNNILVIN